MKENEISIRDGDEIVSVNVDSIPDIIASKIDDISALEKQVEKSDKSAKKAMSYINNEMSSYQEKSFLGIHYRSGNTKDVVEDTQEAVEQLAEAQQVTVEALKKSIEFQKKLADASKYLFDLGCANITVNRIAVRAIEAKLAGASKKKISDLARQEMIAVVTQLKEQEDILKKQDELKAKVKSNAERLNEKDAVDAEQTQRIEELGALLENKDVVDQRQEEAINTNKADISNIKDALNKKDSLDDEQSKRISVNEEAIKILYDYMKTKDELDKEQSKEIEVLKKHKKSILPIIAIVLSIISIGINIFLLLFK